MVYKLHFPFDLAELTPLIVYTILFVGGWLSGRGVATGDISVYIYPQNAILVEIEDSWSYATGKFLPQ